MTVIGFPDGFAELSRDELAELVAGQRESVRIAEEGQEWVDAVVDQVGQVADDTVANLRAAISALRSVRTPDVKAVEEANAVLAAAVSDRQIHNNKATQARRAADAHRAVTVDRAGDRLAIYEQATAAKTPGEGSKIIATFEQRLEAEAAAEQAAKRKPKKP